MRPEPDYWAAAATVLPVLAAAIIFEVKSLLNEIPLHKNPALSTLLRLQQGALLILVVFAEIACFRALRSPEIPEIWTSIVEFCVIGCISSLILAPAFTLLITGAWSTRFLAKLGRLKGRALLIKRRTRRIERAVDKLEVAFEATQAELVELDNTMAEIEQQIADATSNGEGTRADELRDRYQEYQAKRVATKKRIDSQHLILQKVAKDIDMIDKEVNGLPYISSTGTDSSDYRRFDPDFRE